MPISMSDLEARHRQAGDGAESSLWSEDGGQDEDNNEEVAGDDGAVRRATRKRSRREATEDPVDAAVFGGGPGPGSVASESEDGSNAFDPAARGDRRMQAQRRAFPIRGVTCLGCSMDRSMVERVDEHIRQNQNRLEQVALFKSAALFWHQTVVQPAQDEGVPMPDWPWKSVRSHYLLHALDPNMQRGDSIRQLGCMRKTLEMSLLREDEEGNRGLDPKNAELMIKLISLQSKELQLMQASSMPPPPRPPATKRSK